jgi:hypothetical protein
MLIHISAVTAGILVVNKRISSMKINTLSKALNGLSLVASRLTYEPV